MILNFAVFLSDNKKDYDEAEKYYKKALELYPNDARTNRIYAIFLTETKMDYEQAEIYYKKALKIEPNECRNNARYSQLLFILNRDKEGETHWEVSMNNYYTITQTYIPLMLHFYHYAHSKDTQVRAESKAQVEKLLSEGVTSEDWNLTGNLERAKRDGHEELETLIDLATKISVSIDYQHLNPPRT